MKWWRHAFFRLLDAAIVNGYILYQLSHQDGQKYDHKQFRVMLSKQLLGGIGDQTQAPNHHISPLTPIAWLTEHHFPQKVPLCASGRSSQPVCVVCSHKRGWEKKTTTYKCKQCTLPMCIIPCFELYHTKVDPVCHI